jgi:prepilin-type N-terminal cleavage/methylation domain-containing protein
MKIIKTKQSQKGFTLIEVLLVITLIGILIAIGLVSFNTEARFIDARNDIRTTHIQTLESTITQYKLQEGNYPTGLSRNYQEICDPEATDCTGFFDLKQFLVPNYLQAIPQDPNDNDTIGGAGYSVAVDEATNTVSVRSLQAEAGVEIKINDPLPAEPTVTSNTPLAATVPVTPPQLPIVTNGLVLNLDAGNPASYPGTGNTWFDLSGNGNNGTLVNGVGYNSANGGSLVFDGVDDYVVTTRVSNTGNQISSQSYCLWINPDDTNGNVLSMSSQNPQSSWNMPPIAVSSSIFRGKFWNNQYLNATSTYINSQWYYVCLIFSYNSITANAYQRLYINGNLNSEQVNVVYSSSNTNNFIFLGQQNPGADNTGMFKGLYGSIHIYTNKALTPEEVQQNFNATRGRFGL